MTTRSSKTGKQKMKCFYAYTEEDACFDCCVSEKNIFGCYKGEPNEEVILKVKGFAIVVPEKQSLLQICEIDG